jgi:hypothetical protein
MLSAMLDGINKPAIRLLNWLVVISPPSRASHIACIASSLVSNVPRPNPFAMAFGNLSVFRHPMLIGINSFPQARLDYFYLVYLSLSEFGVTGLPNKSYFVTIEMYVTICSWADTAISCPPESLIPSSN